MLKRCSIAAENLFDAMEVLQKKIKSHFMTQHIKSNLSILV